MTWDIYAAEPVPPAEPTWVYRLICEHSALLYVGVANNVNRRLGQHKTTKSWWPDVRVILTDLYATRLQALKVEACYITYYRPRHNIAGQAHLPNLPHPMIQRRDLVQLETGQLHPLTAGDN